MRSLADVMQQALREHDDGDALAGAWEVLVVATVRMARAAAAFESNDQNLWMTSPVW